MFKKKTKCFLTSVLTIFTIFITTSTTFASTSNTIQIKEEPSITTRSIGCPRCRTGSFIKGVHNERLGIVDERNCHNNGHGLPWGSDYLIKYKRTTTYQCDRCGYIHQSTDYYKEWECHGKYQP